MNALKIARALILLSLSAVSIGCETEDEVVNPLPLLDGSTGSGNSDDAAAADLARPVETPVDTAAIVDASIPDVLGPVTGPPCIDAGGAPDGGCFGALAVFNTGVDDSRVSLPGGSVDPHYKLIQSAEATLMGPDAIVTTHIADSYWFAQSESSKWIAPSANQSYPGASPCNTAGTYVYRTSFDLTGFDPATATIRGAWGADNSGTDIRLNGESKGITAPSYNPLAPFTITAGFVAGNNTLEFQMLDIGCPNGLRVELSGTAVIWK
jgi:hypothetical protein